jgi:hypothetical protein
LFQDLFRRQDKAWSCQDILLRSADIFSSAGNASFFWLWKVSVPHHFRERQSSEEWRERNDASEVDYPARING